MSDTLEADLTDAFRRRADALQVTVPDPAAVRSPEARHVSGPRRRVFAAAAVLVVLTAGGLLLARDDGDSGRVETITDRPPTSTGPGPTPPAPTEPTTTTEQAPPAEAAATSLDVGEPLVFEGVTGPTLESLQAVSWAGLVDDRFVIAEAPMDPTVATGLRLLWTRDGEAWETISAPDGEVLFDAVSLDDDLLVTTFDAIEGTPTMWRVDGRFDRFEVQPEIQLPAHPDAPRVWEQVNRPEFFTAGGQLFAFVGAAEAIRIEELALDAGVVGSDERTCELAGNGLELTVTVSATATTDRECQAAEDVRDITLTPELLGISDDDFLLHSERGDHTSFLLSWSDGAIPVVVGEFSGQIVDVRTQGSTVTAVFSATAPEEPVGAMATTTQDPADLDSWTVEPLGGGTGIVATDSTAIAVDDAAAEPVLVETTAGGSRPIGVLPDGVGHFSMDTRGSGVGSNPILPIIDRSTNIARPGILVGVDGRWRPGDLFDVLSSGLSFGSIASIDGRVLVYDLGEPSTLWVADLDR